MSRFLLLFFVAFLGLFSCNSSDKNMMTEQVGKEMNQREIRRISEAEILERAFELGREISDSAQKTLQKHLLQAIEEGGVENAIAFCNVNAYPLLKTLAEENGAEIKRVSNRWRNPADAPDDFELPILEAYEYQKENNLQLEDNVQKEGADILLYTKPILLASPLCLNCHGKAGEEVSQSTLSILAEKYPNDKALNHEPGDLRGMWSIRLKRKNLVLKEN